MAKKDKSAKAPTPDEVEAIFSDVDETGHTNASKARKERTRRRARKAAVLHSRGGHELVDAAVERQSAQVVPARQSALQLDQEKWENDRLQASGVLSQSGDTVRQTVSA